MTITRLANAAATNQLVNRLLSQQRKINELQVQLSTDKVSQNYAGIAKESERLVGLENTTSLLERFSRNNELMDMRLNVTETTLQGIEEVMTDFRNGLLDFSNLDRTNEEEVATIQELAYRSLRSLEGHLNTDINGEFLFAGSRISTQPVDFGISSLAHLQSQYDGSVIKYPTYYDNTVHPKLTASTGSPDDPTNTGFGRLTFAGGLGGTISSDQSGYQTDTITLAGTVQDGDQYKITIDGNPITYVVTGAEANLAAITTNIINAINADPATSALVNATSGSGTGEIILTSDTPGTSFTTTVTASNLPAIAQVDTVTIAGTPEKGDIYSIDVDGTTVNYTVTGFEGSLSAVRSALTAAVNANATAAGIVTARDGAAAGEIILTADTTNSAFTTTPSATDIGAAAQQVDNVTMTGTFAAGDQVSINVDGIGAVSYTVLAADLTDNGGDGTGTDAVARNNIAVKLAAAVVADGPTSAVVTATAPGSGVVALTAVVAGTAFSTVAAETTTGSGVATASTTSPNVVGIADNTATSSTTQAAEAGYQSPIAQVDGIALTGTYAVNDTISVNVNSLGAVTYTVTANDLTVNGDGTGGAATATQARTNIATKLSAALTGDATTSAVVTPSSSGGTVSLTAVTAGTSFSTVSTATDVGNSGGGQTSTVSTTTANFAGGIPAVAQVDNIALTGTYVATDTVSVNIDGLGAVVYTVTANDLTVNGDGTGGAATAAQARQNIASKVAAVLNADATTAAVVTATTSTNNIVLTAVTAGTSFSTVTSATDVTTSGGGQTATGTTTTANAAAIISNADNAATLVSVSATQNPFANIPVGSSITVYNATNAANNTTYTVTANTGSVITVASDETVIDSSGYDLSSGLTISMNTSYYKGDENATTHQTAKNREFELDTTAVNPAFEKAIRAMFIIAQGQYGTAGGLDKNQTRVEDALYLVRHALDANVGGTAPYGTESIGNMEQVQTDIAYHRVLIQKTNSMNQDLIDFFDTEVIGVENIDQLAVITKLLDNQQALEASYQSMARIRQLSLINYL